MQNALALSRNSGSLTFPRDTFLRWSFTLTLIAALLGTTVAQARSAPESFADLAERLLPAVVNISTTQTIKRGEGGPDLPNFPPGSPFEDFFKDFFDKNRPEGRPRQTQSLGSGFVVDPDGYVVTNNHVIDGADEIFVLLQDDTRLPAKLLGTDPKTDIALLKVETSQKLPFVKFGDSAKSRVGDWVMAIGNPFGLGGTVTAGIVSARGRDIRSGPYDNYIQTDASINRGNSGGPMFNMDGDVIGINTAIFSPTGGSVGIGFAVPSSTAIPVVKQLREFGRTKRGWLGVRIQVVSPEIAETLGLDSARGALVSSVIEGGPAEAAKIQAGDVILTFDGKEVGEMRSLPRIVAGTDVGSKVDVDLWRKGKRVSVKVNIEELEEAETAGLMDQPKTEMRADDEAIKSLGLTLSTITPPLTDKYELKADQRGVLVTDVLGDSSAAEKGVRPGDVIVEVGQQEVQSPKDVAARVEQARKDGKKSVLLLVESREGLRFVALRIEQG
ncbi:Do family serine endopeptidase [Alphaproteobacteria bacterium HT1-32]|nr:Do family serine endopeptidase [Alphaproteobacteria bacterium HT1-32]